jgi:hypothetical protein
MEHTSTAQRIWRSTARHVGTRVNSIENLTNATEVVNYCEVAQGNAAGMTVMDLMIPGNITYSCEKPARWVLCKRWM